jgi:DNA-binding XRE family transcriptional regulator
VHTGAVSRDLAQLGQLVRTRREVLQMTQRDASLAAGISDTTWFSVEQGKKVSNRTLARVERAMRWPVGTIDAVLKGERPPLEGQMVVGPPIHGVVVDEPDVLAAITADPYLKEDQKEALRATYTVFRNLNDRGEEETG